MTYTKKLAIDEKIELFLNCQSNENFADLIETLITTNVILVNKSIGGDLKKLNDLGVTPLVITDKEGKNYIPLFTKDTHITHEEVKPMERLDYLFKDLCNDSIITNEYIEGFILNPFTHGLKLPKEVVRIVIKYVKSE